MIDVVAQGKSVGSLAQELAGLAQPLRVETVAPTAIRLHQVARTADVPGFAARHSLDWAILNPPRRWTDFRLLVMDMDSTLITIECIDQLADIAGVGTEVAEITASAMRGELDFPSALRRRVGLLAGLDESALQTVFEERLRLSPGAETLLDAARRRGLKTLLVSGGFTYFTHRLQTQLGLDFAFANTLEMAGSELTGKVSGEIVDAHAKARRVAEVCQTLGCGPDAAVVIGDGANDLEMMAGAGLSVAYRAKPKVQAQAMVALNHSGLDGVTHLLS